LKVIEKVPQTIDDMIDSLVADLQPVRRLSRLRGMVLATVTVSAMIAAVAWMSGFRTDLLAGEATPEFLIPAAMFLTLGLVATWSTVSMAQPHVGARHDEWKWAAAMAISLPVSGLIAGLAGGTRHAIANSPEWGLVCLGASLTAGLLPLAMLIAWLSRGAPSSPGKAGIVAGVAAASLGTFAWSLHCPLNSLLHIGVWHGLAPLAGAFSGFLIAKPFVRW
jgi:hypothetical protein